MAGNYGDSLSGHRVTAGKSRGTDWNTFVDCAFSLYFTAARECEEKNERTENERWKANTER